MLDRLGRRRGKLLAIVLIASTAIAGLAALVWTIRYGLAIHRLNRGVGDTIFLSADGRPWFRLDDHRRDVPLARIAPILRQAVVAVEDHRFYRHPGVDPIALGRAMYRNVRAGRTVEGGSTLTQQLARSLFLSNRRTFGRKAKEAVLAVMLEQQLTKAQILELYLNRVYLGSGRYGVEAMSRAAFSKPAADVTVAEAALLAGLLKSPNGLSPWSNFKAARERSFVVLSRLRQEGYITERAATLARSARLRLGPPPSVDSKGGYAKEFLRAEFRKQFGDDVPADWRVQTTFVPVLQDAAEKVVKDGLRRLGSAELQAGLVALDPKTGDILAIVGGRDANRYPFNRASAALRQPGSAFKPLVYAAALEDGLSPITTLTGLRRVVFQGERGEEEWSPRADGNHGDADRMTAREALLTSNNAAAVLVQQRVGTGSVRRLAGRLGVRDQPDVSSLALGSGLVSPLALAAAYAVFPNGGYAVKPRGLVKVLDHKRELAFVAERERKRVLSEESAFQMVSMLQDVIARGTGSAARTWGLGAVAGKTGTTNDFKDAWFVGFSSDLVTAVWVGFDQPATISPRGYGARVALPIWADFMKAALRARPAKRFDAPPTLVPVELCQVSYLRPVEGCPGYVEFLKEGADRPSRLCTLHAGSFKQELKRAVQGLLDKLKRRVFKWFEERE